MRIESSGHSQGNPRLYELIENAPKTGKSPTVWAWPELIDYLKIAGQPVPGRGRRTRSRGRTPRRVPPGGRCRPGSAARAGIILNALLPGPAAALGTTDRDSSGPGRS